MKFVDQTKIKVSSGAGGDGCIAFRREKYVPLGGPSGGDGGNGGNIIIVGDINKNTLLDYRYNQVFCAESGQNGRRSNMHGRRGKDTVLKFPLGTLIKDTESQTVLADITSSEPILFLRGGKGGRGNARFASSTRQKPEIAEEGQPGSEADWTLELKLMADVGLIGLPNAGKSTLISRISNARPKIASYPFTTLVPQLGLVRNELLQSYVVSDIPGIILGAHAGKGLGHQFLRHIERCKILIIMLDPLIGSSEKIIQNYQVLIDEMRLFNAQLLTKSRFVAITKCDANPDQSQLEHVSSYLAQQSEEVLYISAASGLGIDQLKHSIEGRLFGRAVLS